MAAAPPPPPSSLPPSSPAGSGLGEGGAGVLEGEEGPQLEVEARGPAVGLGVVARHLPAQVGDELAVLPQLRQLLPVRPAALRRAARVVRCGNKAPPV